MFIVSRPIRSEMKPQTKTAKPQHGLVTNWFETTSWLFLPTNWLFFHGNLQNPDYGIRNSPRSEIYHGTSFPSQLQKTYGSKNTNHSQLAWPFELHVRHTGQPRFWLVRFFSQTRSLALSDPIYSTQHRFPVNMSLNIPFISILCTQISWNTKRTISVFENGKIEAFVVEETASSLFRIKSLLIHAAV